jgi:hypothetical protein
VTVGFGNAAVPGCWNPATLTVTNPGSAFKGTVRAQVSTLRLPDGRESEGDVYTLETDFHSGTSALHFVVRPVESDVGLRVQVLRRDEVVFEQQTDPLWRGHRGRATLVFVTPAEKEAGGGKGRPWSMLPATGTEVLLTPAEAPTDVRAYDAASTVVLGDVALSQFPPAAWTAIRRWTATGHVLVLTAPFLARNAASPDVSQLAGVTVLGQRPANGLGEALGLFSRKPIQGALTQVLDVWVPASEVLGSVGGRVLAFEHPAGMGAVRGFAIDPGWSDIPDWPGRTRFRDAFWAKALRGAGSVPASHGSMPWSMVPTYSRLANTGLPLFIALLVFVIVAGPLNCAIVGAIRRKELVVVTTPAIVLLFVLGLLVAALVVHSPFPILVHQTANVTSVDTEGVASLGAFGIFSHGTRTYNLAFDHPQPDFSEFRLNDSGPQQGGWPPTVVSVGTSAGLSNVRVERWSMRAFEETAFVPVGTVEGELTIGADGLTGSVTNRLPFALRDCYLVHKWNHVAVGDLAPGESKALALKLGPPALTEYKLSRMYSLTGPGGWLDRDLWPLRPESTRWEQVGESIGCLTRTVSGPFLLGWGETLVPPPALSGRHSTRGAHLYVAPLRTTIRGPDLIVPVGGAFEPTGNPRSRWLATYSSNESPGAEAPGGRSGMAPPGALSDADVGGVRELLLPVEGQKPEHQRLVIHGRQRPNPGWPAATVTGISLYDWRHHWWKTLTQTTDPTFAVDVPEPGRFILWPPGLIVVATGAVKPGGALVRDSAEAAWIDVEYAGRGGAR